jgi:hypothetical protein
MVSNDDKSQLIDLLEFAHVFVMIWLQSEQIEQKAKAKMDVHHDLETGVLLFPKYETHRHEDDPSAQEGRPVLKHEAAVCLKVDVQVVVE